MPGSPFYSGLFEGFQGRRQSEYERNLEAEGKAREAESNVYKYLLQSTDPKIQSLAMAGLFESARPGTRAKGLRGFMGEVQGGEIYPQILSAMEEQVPDAGTPSAKPQSAALPSTTPVHGGPIGTTPPQGPPAAAAMPQVPEDITAALGMGAPESGFGAPAPGGPAGMGMVGQAPPEHPTHRRGTGVPTAEEVAARTMRAQLQARIQVATESLTEAGATPDEIQRTIMGMMGAPQNARMFDTPTFAVIDPTTNQPTPVSFDHTTGRFAFPDGSPVPRGAKYVRMAGSAGAPLTTKIPDTPEGRQYLIANGADPVEVNAGSPTHYWKLVTKPDGTVGVQADIFVPPPNFIGTAQGLDANGNPVLFGVPRGGGAPGPGNIIAPAVTGQPTEEQSNAAALLAEINEAVKAAEAPVYPGQPPQRLTPLQRDTIARERASAARLPYTTYYEVQQAARQQRRPSPSPTTPKPAAVPGGGGSAMSLADQVRADLLAQQAGRAGAAPAPPPAAAPPARARGAGPAGR